jgi:hypothetical protein
VFKNRVLRELILSEEEEEWENSEYGTNEYPDEV